MELNKKRAFLLLAKQRRTLQEGIYGTPLHPREDVAQVFREAHAPLDILARARYMLTCMTLGYYWPTMEIDSATFVKRCKLSRALLKSGRTPRDDGYQILPWPLHPAWHEPISDQTQSTPPYLERSSKTSAVLFSGVGKSLRVSCPDGFHKDGRGALNTKASPLDVIRISTQTQLSPEDTFCSEGTIQHFLQSLTTDLLQNNSLGGIFDSPIVQDQEDSPPLELVLLSVCSFPPVFFPLCEVKDLSLHHSRNLANLRGEQVTNFDDNVDNSPENDLALNVDHVFEADECDAFDSVLAIEKSAMA
ncbi:hypothetical protein Tco_0357159 [Tanacetum coccineum]